MEADFGITKVEGLQNALVANESADSALYLEEFVVNTKKEDLTKLIAQLSKLMGDGEEKKKKKQLVVVSDDMFNHLSQFATPVNAHIAIDSATKIVKNGALWYEETLPPETVLYSLLLANGSRKEEANGLELPNKIMEQTEAIFSNGYIQIGGNETVGMGWCKAALNG